MGAFINLNKRLRAERFYFVEAEVEFRLKPDTHLSIAELKAIIGKADAAYPWKDGVYSGVKIDPTLATQMVPERGIYKFSVSTVGRQIKKGQVYGFEKYVAQMLTHLRDQNIPNVIEIGIQVITKVRFQHAYES